MLHLTLDDKLFIGKGIQVGTHSTAHDHLAVIFEDDGETGYFYALDTNNLNQPVVDSLHVYNVSAAEEPENPRKLQICWDETGYQAFLMINDYPHAMFDFNTLVGYNHSKKPEPDLITMWSREEVTTDLVKQWLG